MASSVSVSLYLRVLSVLAIVDNQAEEYEQKNYVTKGIFHYS